jgi:hypothetical protein
MPARTALRPWAAALLGVAMIVSACGGASATPSPTPSPTPTAAPTPTPSPTPSPTAAPTASPSASAAVDPAAGLAIADPYTIKELDAAAAETIQGAMEKGMGAFASVIQVGTREIQKAGTTVGYVLVIAFPAGTLTDETYKGFLAGIATTSTSTWKVVKVDNYSISTGTMSGISVGMFRAGDAVMLIMAPSAAEVVPIAKALIAANK